MKTPYYGTHLDFDDELNIVEVPHAFVKLRGKQQPFIPWYDLNANWLGSYVSERGGSVIRHVDQS